MRRNYINHLYIRTFGCQMNERDSEIICGMMIDEGYSPVTSYEDADLVIFNTCSVRKHAEDRVWGKLEQIKGIGKGKEKPIIGLVGCMGKAYGKDIFKRLPHVDFVCGPADIYKIPKLVDKVGSGKNHITAVKSDKRPIKKDPGSYRDEKIRAWVNISEGCNNFCSYCIVPYVRGREVSRPREDIIDEIKQLIDNGTKEVTLLGQNVNSYGGKTGDRGQKTEDKKYLSAGKAGKTDFVWLLEEINKIDGLERIRFMTSHPKDAKPVLFKAMKELDKVCEHFHLPLQSGSDSILKAMNRGYTSSHYLKLVEGLRKELPDAAITTDIIVGFPGESDKDFKDTYMMMKKIGFNSAFIFKYSSRPFTKAANLKDDVQKEVKEDRNQVLLNLQDKITKKKNDRLVGKSVEALGISRAKRSPSSSYDSDGCYIKGRTRANNQVVYKGDKDLIGEISDVKIKAVEENTLIGEIA